MRRAGPELLPMFLLALWRCKFRDSQPASRLNRNPAMYIRSHVRVAAGTPCSWRRRQAGISLIELVMFIMIVSIALAGVLSVMNNTKQTGVLSVINITTKNSADPKKHKQTKSVAESLLEEIEAQAFTWCDPDDPNVTTATGTAGCAAGRGGT